MLNKNIDKISLVDTGEIKVRGNRGILKAAALGSCVAVLAFDPQAKTGGLSHIMLPGSSPSKIRDTKYAPDAMCELIDRMVFAGADKKNIYVGIIGGANVLRRKMDTIGEDNYKSILSIIKKNKFKIKGISFGGEIRRSATLDIKTGTMYYTIGDGKERVLSNR